MGHVQRDKKIYRRTSESIKYEMSEKERACFKEDYSVLLKGHNLVKLYKAIVEEGIALEISINGLRTLKDYYFDANYPGDNFVLVTQEELKEAYELTQEVLEKVKRIVETQDPTQKATL